MNSYLDYSLLEIVVKIATSKRLFMVFVWTLEYYNCNIIFLWRNQQNMALKICKVSNYFSAMYFVWFANEEDYYKL